VSRELALRGAVGVPLTAEDVAGYYDRFANGALWPVLHDRPDLACATAADWARYQAVNERFADVVAGALRPGDRVWIHDYHLLLLPRLLRARRPEARIGVFLHTPFPGVASLTRLPRHAALLDGLLGADVVGLHTPAYQARLVEAVGAVLGRRADAHEVPDGDRRVRLHASPMGIDAAAFEARAADPAIAPRVAMLRRGGGPLFVGVDRLDYTKGLPERLRAFARLLERDPALRGRARLFQLAVPSREDVPAYQALRAEVEALVARINARFGDDRWTPVEYVYGSLGADDLAALYRAADVMLVTPLRDGMNLVAKEFVASRGDEDGVLVLSAGAGAAGELRAALLVDPGDVDGMASACETALAMSPAERRVRMRRLRRTVHRHDVHQWTRECLMALGAEGAGGASRSAG
jgi:trehalose 6-phosphate synthase/phosphatase